MEKPYKYHIFCNKTNEYTFTDTAPRLDELQTWEPTEDPKVRILKQTKTCFIDTRYNARLRLYKWWMRKQGIKEWKYDPFKGTEIGKSLPILNF